MSKSSLKLFVASSRKAGHHVERIGEMLSKQGAEIISWKDSFLAGEFLLESLSNIVNKVDGAVILVSDDERLVGDEEEKFVSRGNVILEIGAFITGLGLKQTAIVVVKSENPVQTPGYLDGLNVLKYDPTNPVIIQHELIKWLDGLVRRQTRVSGNDVSQAFEMLRKELHRLPELFSERLHRCPMYGKCLLPTGIENIYSARKEAYQEIMQRIRNANSSVDMMGIALRPFFHTAGDQYGETVQCLKEKAIKWRILILDPNSDQALLRSLRENQITYQSKLSSSSLSYRQKSIEDIRDCFFETHKHTDVYQDIEKTTEFFQGAKYAEWQSKPTLRRYYAPPVAFLIIVDRRTLFIEQYHFGDVSPGTNVRVGEQVPFFEFGASSPMFNPMKGHFDHVWDCLSSEPPYGPSP